MISPQRLTKLMCGLALLSLTSCLNTPLQQLQRKLRQAPEALITGVWVGQFEFDDPEKVAALSRSVNGADRDMLSLLTRHQQESHWFKFYSDGQVEFYDPSRRRSFQGRWRVAGIEGRTAVVNIEAGAGFAEQKPLVFLTEDVLIVRPRLNSPQYSRFGRVVYRRYKGQAAS